VYRSYDGFYPDGMARNCPPEGSQAHL
jgi:hypothetical protein